MSAADEAAALREQAKRLDQVGKLEEKAAEAKAAYQADPTNEKLKAKHRAAGQALADAREAGRPRTPRVFGQDDDTTTVTPEPANAAGHSGEVQ